ncbi:hypothetical protein C4F40_04710 [Sphingobacterium sp. Ka21]|uniref:Uncharacterized protein n=1 Tax=Sphingobacterium pedocola TaxID=2082722 RepID=A0ABR9T3V6_9SPHI|nr:hypothetical protein [Sphingobacterium pedocola]
MFCDCCNLLERGGRKKKVLFNQFLCASFAGARRLIFPKKKQTERSELKNSIENKYLFLKSSLYPFATVASASSCYWQMAKATFVEDERIVYFLYNLCTSAEFKRTALADLDVQAADDVLQNRTIST